MHQGQNQFGFGIETEHLLIDSKTFRPLFHRDLPFDQLLDLVDDIAVEDFPTDGFNVKPLHRKASPYLIEGYYLTDTEMKPRTLLTKGVEIRTPIASTLGTTISRLRELTERLRQKIAPFGWSPATISHHPTEFNFHAAPNYRRHDYWQWALTAMTTYGPDMNISVPESLTDDIDHETLGQKINYYIPSVVALSFNSPLVNGSLWQVNGETGKSFRTFKRSLWAPLYYIHTEPALRFEFKGFEMAQDMNDYKAFFLCGLSMLLDSSLTGRDSDEYRLKRLQNLAIHGLNSSDEQERAAAVLASAEKLAYLFDFDSSSLRALWQRLETNTCPADKIIETFNSTKSIEETMRHLVVQPMHSDIIAINAESLAIQSSTACR
jgi:carboxylate-amine ligase